ncbi:Cytochrome oxidase assembly protein ShyY1 [Marinospirillum celere]|uniref:SURF1-like protein n=2 Tax=Marinospirillum celere TaxID=1122252 RepID=A0A1I1IWU7_9GAMM|nr:Cytochrome oxidase assembly protein ShyY1 [Marinospirillum celere]
MALGLLLSNWQWQRAAEKQDLEERLAEVSQTTNPQVEPEPHSLLVLEGEFLAERTLWLDNRILDGQLGVAALTPLVTETGRWWLVQRGFEPTPVDRSYLPSIETPAGQVEIEGRWQQLQGQALVFGDNREGDRLQSISLEPWADLPGSSFAGVVHQLEGEGKLRSWWKPNQMPVERHQGYAVQWLLLASLALVMAVIGHRRWFGEKKV